MGHAGLSLRAKIVLILAAVVLAYAVLDAAVQRFVVYPSFESLEQQGASRDLERVREALANELSHLELRSWDWTRSQEVHELVEGRSNPQRRLDTFALAGNRLHLIVLCTRAGDVVWSSGTLDPGAEVPEVVRFRDFPPQKLSDSHPLLGPLVAQAADGMRTGLMRTEHGILLVCARSFRTPRNGDGVVMLGRLLTENFVAGLAQQTGVRFRIAGIQEAPSDPQERAAFDEATATGVPVIRVVNDDALSARLCLSDLQQAPIAMVEAQLERSISQRGNRAMQYALSSTVAAGLLMMLVLLFLLQRAVLRPIATLTQHAVEIGRSETLDRRIALDRQDEFGVLSREFDGMVEKLAQSRAELVKTARAAGMSEIATGVLHNVGNVLNSVNVSAALVTQQVARSGAEDLRRVIETIRASGAKLDEFVAKDPRGKHLDPLLEQIATQLVSERVQMSKELGTLNGGIEHIKQLIASQQSIAGRAGVLETVAIDDQIESAIQLTSAASAGAQLEIEREFAPIGTIQIDRHRMMQVLVNVIQNARQALLAQAQQPARLRISTRMVDEDRFQILIQDNGVGIAPENLSRIFTHGFTTRRDGHGFGLHSCANAAAEMGGRLSASSDGPGRGATFTLELPLRRPRSVAMETAA